MSKTTRHIDYHQWAEGTDDPRLVKVWFEQEDILTWHAAEPGPHWVGQEPCVMPVELAKQVLAVEKLWASVQAQVARYVALAKEQRELLFSPVAVAEPSSEGEASGEL
jgi:hypothetical protein